MVKNFAPTDLFWLWVLTIVTLVTILYAARATSDNEMTPRRCSFHRALHD
jgi:hypothetical protein